MTKLYIQNYTSTRAMLVRSNLKDKRLTGILRTMNLYLKDILGKRIKVKAMLDKIRQHFWGEICDYNFK